MTHKIITVGNSSAVTLPPDLLKLIHLRAGEKVTIEHDAKRGGLVILPVRRSKVDAELLEWTDTIIEKYRPALEALAKK
ncbi:MAG: AbrB/MazE/SpoVT family DNA-binding domain-containing protein [Candidatus Kerfeldbacteria bacterium]|nr:AbrB/MazE/SpoVT family DNA-binding domain-containing protein [Candidatus Kerfeldbacteria bacterium]